MEHENDPDIDEPFVPPVGNVLGGEADSQSTTEQPSLADTAEGHYFIYRHTFIFSYLLFTVGGYLLRF